MEALVPLIRDVPRFSVWQFDMIADWMAYFWNKGTISFVIDERGTAHGVCTIKLFSRLEQFLEPFVHEPCGKFCMVEVLVGDSAQVTGFMCDELVDRWGKQAIVLWDRGERTEGGAPRMWRWNEFEKVRRRMTNYGRLKCSLTT
jgi:hypothetical protein